MENKESSTHKGWSCSALLSECKRIAFQLFQDFNTLESSPVTQQELSKLMKILSKFPAKQFDQFIIDNHQLKICELKVEFREKLIYSSLELIQEFCLSSEYKYYNINVLSILSDGRLLQKLGLLYQKVSPQNNQNRTTKVINHTLYTFCKNFDTMKSLYDYQKKSDNYQGNVSYRFVLQALKLYENLRLLQLKAQKYWKNHNKSKLKYYQLTDKPRLSAINVEDIGKKIAKTKPIKAA